MRPFYLKGETKHKFDLCQCSTCSWRYVTNRDVPGIKCMAGLYEPCTPERDCSMCAPVTACCEYLKGEEQTMKKPLEEILDMETFTPEGKVQVQEMADFVDYLGEVIEVENLSKLFSYTDASLYTFLTLVGQKLFELKKSEALAR